jgi:hypothetical protein
MTTEQPAEAVLEVRRVRLEELHHDPANARKHGPRNLENLVASLQEFGQVEPLVVQKGTGKVIGGNGRLTAMKSLGYTECDIVEFDGSPIQAAALGITLNHSAELASWDFEALGDTIRALQDEEFDISVLGWQDHELEPILAADWVPPSAQELPGVDDRGGDDESADTGDVIRLSVEQRATVDRAIARLRHEHDDSTLSEGWCVGRIAALYLGDVG